MTASSPSRSRPPSHESPRVATFHHRASLGLALVNGNLPPSEAARRTTDGARHRRQRLPVTEGIKNLRSGPHHAAIGLWWTDLRRKRTFGCLLFVKYLPSGLRAPAVCHQTTRHEKWQAAAPTRATDLERPPKDSSENNCPDQDANDPWPRTANRTTD